MLSLKDIKKNGMLREIKYNENFAYVLEENDSFLNTDYKMLQGQQEDIFIPCMKMIYNGKIQLVYLVENCHSLLAGMQLLSARKIAIVVTNIVTNYLKIKNNGFLQCNKLIVDFEKIFFDPNTLQTKFVYLPASIEINDVYSDVEVDLRRGLITILQNKFEDNNAQCQRMLSYLENYENPLEKMMKSCTMVDMPDMSGAFGMTSVSANYDGLTMKSVNATTPMVIRIDKPRITLGKSARSVDVVIKESDTISRVHCCVGREGKRYYVQDMGSLNGTFLNGIKIYSNQKMEIRKGDRLQLANMIFVLE